MRDEKMLRALIRETLNEPDGSGLNRFAGGVPPGLEPLAAEARKAPSYEDFERDYMMMHKNGLYWHVTTDSDFKIDPNKGPQDKSAAGFGSVSIGGLMFTSYLKHWANYYGKQRPYAALLDLSGVDRDKYRQVSRGFGNEFYLANAAATGITIKGVYPIRKARTIDAAYDRLLPKSYKELKQFYDTVTRT